MRIASGQSNEEEVLVSFFKEERRGGRRGGSGSGRAGTTEEEKERGISIAFVLCFLTSGVVWVSRNGSATKRVRAPGGLEAPPRRRNPYAPEVRI